MRQGEPKETNSKNRGKVETTPEKSSPRLSEDARLLEAVMAGDDGAIETFLQRMRCIPQMIGAIVKRRGPALGPEERFEVSQEVFSRIWSHLDRFSGRSRLESWAYGYCALVLAERRRARRTPSLDASEITPMAASARGLAEDERTLLHEALGGLAPSLRTVVDLKHFEGLSFPELSRRIGISPNTAKTRYYRAIALLRSRLHHSLRPQHATPKKEIG